MQQELRRKWKGWILVPGILIGISLAVIIYVSENPGGVMEERMLNYPSIFRYYRQHIWLVVVSCALAIGTGVPVGIMLSRPKFRHIGKVIENIVNVGQTVPSLAILALFFAYLGPGFTNAVFALWLYSILPILRNTYAGIVSIQPNIVEAARGMGMTPYHILHRIELPLAYPVILAGVRTAVVINVGTATLATFIGAGGLGDLIVTGISVRRDMIIFTGAALSALLAILLDHILGQVEEHLIGP